MELLPTGHQYDPPGAYLLTGDNKRYNNGHDVQMRLTKTIVFWKGLPVYVKQVYDGTKIVLWDMQPGTTDFVVESNDSRLDITSPPLGFFHYGSKSFYVVRRPIRSQRQGLDIDRLIFYDIAKANWANFARDEDVFKGFRRMLTRDYPQLSVLLGENWSSAGFARTWALRRTQSARHMIVFHKTEAVGIFNPQTKTFTFQEGEKTRLRANSLRMILAKQYEGNYVIR